MTAAEQPLTVVVDESHTVSALLTRPSAPIACYVLAHGAGAGMTHPFLAAVAAGLADRDVATLRYQFPFMQQGRRRVDPPALAQATVRAAVAAAIRTVPGVPVFAGGKSFGGRMTSAAQAAAPLPSVRGLAFLGFPLHPAGKPSDSRGAHLADVHVPMLFLQGTRDALADLNLLAPLLGRMGPQVRLVPIEAADHGFHVPARSGRTDRQVLAQIVDELTAWMSDRISGSG